MMMMMMIDSITGNVTETFGTENRLDARRVTQIYNDD